MNNISADENIKDMDKCFKRKRTVIPIATKIEILEKLGEGKSSKSLANEYGIGQSTIYDMCKNADKIIEYATMFEQTENILNNISYIKIPKDLGFDIPLREKFINCDSYQSADNGRELKKVSKQSLKNASKVKKSLGVEELPKCKNITNSLHILLPKHILNSGSVYKVPDLGERLTGGDGPSGTKVDATPSSFLPCSPILHGSLDDLGAPSLNYQDSLCHREARSDFSQSEHVDIKTEPLFPSQTEIDDDSIVGNTQSSGPPSRQQSPIPPGMTGPYLLKKETHCNTILDELMKDETFTDVTLTAEGQHIKAHRIILCLSSKYFKEVLSKDSNAKNIIFFRDIKFEELKNIISFIYTGEVTVDATDLESFMKTAELLEVTSLCEGQKNFPKGFPLYRNPEPSSSEIPKVSAATKRSSTSDAHSPPLKSRKVNAEAAVQRPSRKFHQAAASYSPPVIKPEPLSQSDIEEETTKEAGDNKEDIYSDLGSKDTDRANEEKETHTGSSSDYEETFQAGRKEEAEPPGVGDITTTTTPGRCPFCPATQILFTGSAILTHLQVSHSDETAYPCENCYRVFTTKSIFLGHHRDCAR